MEKTRNEVFPKKLWLLIFVVAATMTLAFLTALLIPPIAKVLGINPGDLQGTDSRLTPATLTLILSYALSQFLLIFLVQRFVHKRPFKNLGFRAPALKRFFIGLAIGLLFAGINRILELIAGGDVVLEWSVPSGTSVFSVIIYAVFSLVIMLTINSLKEELVFRAYPLEQFMEKRKSMILAVVLLSLLFSAMHHIIQPFHPVAFIARFLFALLYSYVYIQWRSI